MKDFILHKALSIVLVVILAGCDDKDKLGAVQFREVDSFALEGLSCMIRPIITVFIHGTRVFPKFHAQELYYSPDGFNHINAIEKASHMHTIARSLERSAPQKYPYRNFYTFGWNGNLDFEERKKASKNLYKALEKLSSTYTASYGVRPYVRIITHSHGGNVALNLAAIAHETYEHKFFIDELIMLAVPVQQETKDFVLDPCFGRIYSLSSSNDMLQVVDPQGLYKRTNSSIFFSERYFKGYSHVLQAQVKMQGRFLMHIEFLMGKLFKYLPAIVDVMDTWYSIAQKQSLPITQIPIIDVYNETIKICPTLYY